MNDFKIGDNIEEQTPEQLTNKRNKSRKFAVIIVVIISLLIGITTFLISNAIFNKKEPEQEIDYSVDIKDENVQILYKYVTYGTRGIRNDKYTKEKEVTIDSFNNDEKFFYALQFAQPGDFEYTGEVNSEKKKIYLITDKTIKKYMQLYFGPNIKYKNDEILSYPFSFKINGMNVGDMKYSDSKGGFETTFTSFQDELKKEEIKNDVVGKLESAKTDKNNKLILTEKVVYLSISKNEDNTYKIELYKDYNKEIRLDQKTVTNLDDKIDISNLENTSTIEYTFALNGTTYYFESSRIIV